MDENSIEPAKLVGLRGPRLDEHNGLTRDRLAATDRSDQLTRLGFDVHSGRWQLEQARDIVAESGLVR
jgi:hypothetical protein